MHTDKRKQNTRRTVLKITAVALAAVLLISTVLFLLSLWERQYGQFTGDEQVMKKTLT